MTTGHDMTEHCYRSHRFTNTCSPPTSRMAFTHMPDGIDDNAMYESEQGYRLSADRNRGNHSQERGHEYPSCSYENTPSTSRTSDTSYFHITHFPPTNANPSNPNDNQPPPTPAPDYDGQSLQQGDVQKSSSSLTRTFSVIGMLVIVGLLALSSYTAVDERTSSNSIQSGMERLEAKLNEIDVKLKHNNGPTETPKQSTETRQQTTETITTQNCMNKCYECIFNETNSDTRCQANGDLDDVDHGMVLDCPCTSTCYSVIKPGTGVVRGCTDRLEPQWTELASNGGCHNVTGGFFVCFCSGNRCNNDDMTKYPLYNESGKT